MDRIFGKSKSIKGSSDESIVRKETHKSIYKSVSEAMPKLGEHASSTTLFGSRSSKGKKPDKERDEDSFFQQVPQSSAKGKEKRASAKSAQSESAVTSVGSSNSRDALKRASESLDGDSHYDTFERDWSGSEEGWTSLEVRRERPLDRRPFTATELRLLEKEFRSSELAQRFLALSKAKGALLKEVFVELVSRPEAVAMMRTYGVSIVEAAAIFAFVDKHKKFNAKLHSGQPLSGVAKVVIENLRSGLQKLPRFQGDLYAVTMASDRDLRKVKKGRFGDSTEAINSFSKHLDHEALKSCNLCIVTKPSPHTTAADVSMFCRFPEDGEVLILPEDGHYRFAGWTQKEGYIEVD